MADYSKDIWDFLFAVIGNEYGVAGLMGNLEAESNLQPNNLENSYESALGYNDETYTTAVNNGSYSRGSFVNDSAGYGIAQWTYSTRKAGLYDFWKATGLDSIADIGVQLGWLYLELQNDFPGVWSTLKTATSVRQASDKVLHDFENPADQSGSVEEYRESLCKKWYAKYSENGGGDTPTPTPKKRLSLLLMYMATRRKV